MIGLSLSVTPSELGVALGIAFTDRLGAVANAIIANPIKTMRLTGGSSCFLGAGSAKITARRTLEERGLKPSPRSLSPKRELERPPAVPAGNGYSRIVSFLRCSNSRLIREFAPAPRAA